MLSQTSVEGVLESYGLPHKGEFDPTTIMSFFYVFFFGMMLSDAAYGAIIAIACFVALKKFPRMSKSMRKSMTDVYVLWFIYTCVGCTYLADILEMLSMLSERHSLE